MQNNIRNNKRKRLYFLIAVALVASSVWFVGEGDSDEEPMSYVVEHINADSLKSEKELLSDSNSKNALDFFEDTLPEMEKKLDKKNKSVTKGEKQTSIKANQVFDSSKLNFENRPTKILKSHRLESIEIQNLTASNNRKIANELVSYMGGNEVIKGEVFDGLVDYIKVMDYDEDLSKVKIDFFVNSSGVIEEVLIKTNVPEHLNTKIRNTISELNGWQEGNHPATVQYELIIELQTVNAI